MSATSNQGSTVRSQESHPSFICPITSGVMQDPVIDKHGHSFERSAITTWLKDHTTCPINRQSLVLEDLAPNRALKELIETPQFIAVEASTEKTHIVKPVPHEQNDTMARPLLQGAQNLEKDGKLEEAEKFYLMAYQYTSKSEDYANFPKLLEKKQEKQQAGEAYIILADLQQSENKPQEAIKSLRKSLELQPQLSIKERLARLLKENKNNEESSKLFLELAQQSLYNQDRQKGVQFCRLAIEVHAAWAEPWKTLAGGELDPIPVLMKGARESSMPIKERISLCKMVLIKDPEHVSAQLLLLNLKLLKTKEKIKQLQAVIIHNNLKIPPSSLFKSQSTTTAAVVPAVAFGAAEWKRFFGEVGVEPPLPPKIYEILNSSCPYWPGKTVLQTHLLTLVPQTVDGQPLNLKLLGELIKKPLLGPATQFRKFALGEYADLPNFVSHWVLMTREPVPASTQRVSECVQQILINQLNHRYKIPSILDVAVGACTEYVKTGNRLPKTFVRCPEMYNSKRRLLVGEFSEAGLHVSCYSTTFDDREIHTTYTGILGCLKF